MSELEENINRFSDSEKILLVVKIWNSIAKHHQPRPSAAQKREIDKRMQLIQSGEAVFLTLDEIKERFKTLKQWNMHTVCLMLLGWIIRSPHLVWYEKKRFRRWIYAVFWSSSQSSVEKSIRISSQIQSLSFCAVWEVPLLPCFLCRRRFGNGVGMFPRQTQSAFLEAKVKKVNCSFIFYSNNSIFHTRYQLAYFKLRGFTVLRFQSSGFCSGSIWLSAIIAFNAAMVRDWRRLMGIFP